MRTLYVSDLDGTLLQSDEKTSDFTNQTINQLVGNGMLFSYATARSFHTSHKVTNGLNANIPLVLYNGAMVIDNVDGSILLKNIFSDDIVPLLKDLFSNNVFPIVYAWIEQEENLSFIPSKCTRGMQTFLNSRRNDRRIHPVDSVLGLFDGDIFYITCIDKPQKLIPLYKKYKDIYHCVYQINSCSKEYWLEIMPKCASKSNAIKQLQDRMKCERLIVFGDGINDIDMFKIADEAYAVENAIDALKAIATDIIPSNNDNGVARWLMKNYYKAL